MSHNINKMKSPCTYIHLYVNLTIFILYPKNITSESVAYKISKLNSNGILSAL